MGRENRPPALYRTIADRAKALWDEGLSILQVAEQLGVSPPTATAAVRHGYEVQGLPTPTWQDRQDAMMKRLLEAYEAGSPMTTIAKDIGLSITWVRRLLKEHLQTVGQPYLDGRTRRWHALPSCSPADEPSAPRQ